VAETAPRGAGAAEQVAVIGERSARRIFRQPALLAFPFVFPLLLFAINASGLGAAAKIPGFPDASYEDFALAVPFVQGALFVAIQAGTAIARDIESGFLNRLSLTPLRGAALVLGQLGGALVLGAVLSVVYLLVGLLVGVPIASGPAGALVLVALSTTIAFAFSSLGALIAIRFGTGEAVQGFFPLLFVALFLSSAFLPRELIAQDWFRTIATWNPVSYMVEGIRSLILVGWDGEALALAFGCAGAILVAGLALCVVSLRTRLTRT